MSKFEILKFLILRSIGNFLLLFAIFGVGATFAPSLYYEFQYRMIRTKGVHFTVLQNKKSSLGEVLTKIKTENKNTKTEFKLSDIVAAEKELVLIPKDTDFGILIPKIGANAKVIPNVDPSNEKEFLKVLQKGVAHAKGTVFPGIKGNSYLFAHSTDNFWDVGRYNAVFYLLKDLVPGDDVVVFFENRRYNYKVVETKVADATDVTSLVDNRTNEEQLILQTCWPPGTTWKRLLVVAKPK
ncbi:sortase [Candidatus Microgenomates bacterium]|nr:MAG: sortase [Candidatus Microgenomates bacterium]